MSRRRVGRFLSPGSTDPRVESRLISAAAHMCHFMTPSLEQADLIELIRAAGAAGARVVMAVDGLEGLRGADPDWVEDLAACCPGLILIVALQVPETARPGESAGMLPDTHASRDRCGLSDPYAGHSDSHF